MSLVSRARAAHLGIEWVSGGVASRTVGPSFQFDCVLNNYEGRPASLNGSTSRA